LSRHEIGAKAAPLAIIFAAFVAHRLTLSSPRLSWPEVCIIFRQEQHCAKHETTLTISIQDLDQRGDSTMEPAKILNNEEEEDILDFTACIEACIKCAIECENCSDTSIDDNAKVSARIARDCADVCWQAAAMMSRNSSLAMFFCSTCESICTFCAEECEKNSHLVHCKSCAEACRICAEECSKIAVTEI
jgi:hypothetical protein